MPLATPRIIRGRRLARQRPRRSLMPLMRPIQPQLSLPMFQKIILRVEFALLGDTWGLIGGLVPPSRWTAPRTTSVGGAGGPLIGTVATTGEGNSPPPTNVADRLPPQMPEAPTAPEPVSRLTQ